MTPPAGPMPEIRRAAGLYLLPAAVVGADALTKQVALALLFVPGRVVDVLPFMRLVPVWNPGISFGMLQDAGDVVSWLLTAFAVAVGLFLPWYTRHWESWGRIGGRLMAGGAIGNAIDRMLYGKVVDFVDLHAGQWHWPAFNVADIGITVGAGLILVGTAVNTYRRNSSDGEGE